MSAESLEPREVGVGKEGLLMESVYRSGSEAMIKARSAYSSSRGLARRLSQAGPTTARPPASSLSSCSALYTQAC